MREPEPTRLPEPQTDPADDSENEGGASASPAPPADVLTQVRRIGRENERLFEELLGAERRYRGLARAVWSVQEQERRRLARELHDGIGQTLTALKNHLERLAGKARESSSRFADDVAAASEMAGAAVHDTRELSRLLRPPVLDDLGLVPALRWLTRTLEERTGLEVRLVVGGDLSVDGDGERLEPEIETVVFRVVQEALNNALKHSGARRAEVTVEADVALVRVTIADHGAGFDPDVTLDGAASGVGLTGMRDRVELFGGHLELDAAPGRGTEIRLVVPRDLVEGPAWARSGEGR